MNSEKDTLSFEVPFFCFVLFFFFLPLSVVWQRSIIFEAICTTLLTHPPRPSPPHSELLASGRALALKSERNSEELNSWADLCTWTKKHQRLRETEIM